MSGRRFIRIGAPAGDVSGEAPTAGTTLTQASAGGARVGAAREEQAAAGAPVRLPPEVFGAWAEDLGDAAREGEAVKPASAPRAQSTAGTSGSGRSPGDGHGAGKSLAHPAGGIRATAADKPRYDPAARAVPRRGGAAPRPAAAGPPPMRNGRISYEDDRLNQMRHSRRPVEVICFGGLHLNGRVVAFDQYAIILADGDEETVVFKHGVVFLRYAD